MRIAIMGAGGVGGCLGGLLAKSGNDVSLIVRGEHLEAIRANGLKLIRPSGEFVVEVEATADPAEPSRGSSVTACSNSRTPRSTSPSASSTCPRPRCATERSASRCSALSNASRANPLFLVLDDLHWADRPTLMMLQHVARNLEGSRLVIVGTYRDMELDRQHPFSSALAELRRDPGFERVLLRGLSVEEVLALIEAMAQGVPLGSQATQFAQAIHRETEGNPFFTRSVLAHLTESGAFEQRDGAWITRSSVDRVGIPEGVRDVIGRRLSLLSDACNETFCRQHRPAKGHQASARLHEVGIYLPHVPRSTRAQESWRRIAWRIWPQTGKSGADAIRREDCAGERHRHS